MELKSKCESIPKIYSNRKTVCPKSTELKCIFKNYSEC